MKGILQYCATEDGTYKNVGTIRSAKNQDYRIEAVTAKNRIEEVEALASRVYVRALCLELNDDFLDQDEWFFRIAYFDDLVMVKLGEHPYTIDYDGLLRFNQIEYHTVEISFTINFDEYDYYGDTEPLPEEEGGIIVEDDDIYIE